MHADVAAAGNSPPQKCLSGDGLSKHFTFPSYLPLLSSAIIAVMIGREMGSEGGGGRGECTECRTSALNGEQQADAAYIRMSGNPTRTRELWVKSPPRSDDPNKNGTTDAIRAGETSVRFPPGASTLAFISEASHSRCLKREELSSRTSMYG